ncbi:hypothetical protein ACUOA8_62595, partial [Escherichia sp. SS-MK2]
LFKRQDLKIAVIGLTTDDTAKIGNPEYFTDVEFRKPADEAKLVIQELHQCDPFGLPESTAPYWSVQNAL